ncbi:helix-turn-helix domain-containing protein [Paenibacillus sp. PR3]|uniref:Helix-turn-helix domain-containing protein n=1 Tax=Paenibacillus terricola TaxID=2763503 RepID=A0ABR8MZ16_9BACL|nr:helix-turn-helix domain-containing protein [Paenibacillus terricola]MBD3919769.1 helix-turn-helix domain-containing protein [Paenibacillus terricola]
MVDPIVVGSNILAGRKRLGLSQTGLGDTLRVSHQAVSKWERGECLPDIDALVGLAGLFGSTIDELLRKREETEPIPAVQEDGVEIWRKVQDWMRERITEPSYRTHFEPTLAFIDENGELVVQCATPFQAQWLFTRYMHFILQALDESAVRPDLKLKFIHASKYGPDKHKARFQTDRISLGETNPK